MFPLKPINTLSKTKIGLIAALSLTFILPASAVFAALTFNTTSIVSDGALTLTSGSNQNIVLTTGTGYVGIDTATPAYKLDVKGSGSIGARVFTGTGLNDLTSGGAYTGTDGTNPTYTVIVDGIGTPDTFKWKKNSGSFTTTVPITGSAQTLSDGVTITFAATTGHTLNDQWVTTVTLANPLSTLSADGSTRGLTVLNSGNVGIGTTGPPDKLSVNGNISLNYGTVDLGGLANDHSYQIYVTPDELDLKGFNHIAFNLVAPSGEVMRITSHANIGSVGIGTTTPAGLLDISKAVSATPSLTGQYISLSASTLTDNNTAASGTLTNAVFNSIAAPTLAATNTGVTTTNAYTFYIAGAPTAGTNETVTNPYALGVNGNTKIAGTVTGLTGLTLASGRVIKSLVTGLTALAGGAQAGTALTGDINVVTTVTSSGDSVQLPTAVAGMEITVINKAAANSMNVFPQTGGAINEAAANAAYAVAAKVMVECVAIDSTTWECQKLAR